MISGAISEAQSRQRCSVALLSLLGSLACFGCAASHPQLRSVEDLSAPRRGWREADDEPSRTMRTVARLLEPLGMSGSHEGFAGFLSTGARATHPLRVPEQTCATLVAIASRAVHDMDATLYSAEGEAIASDAQPDAHPALQICTGPKPITLYYALQVYDGAGTYLVVPFFGKPATLEAAATLLGAKPGVARLDSPTAGGPSRIASFREGLERRGFERVRDDVRFPLQRDQRLRVPMPVEPGQCYTAASFAFEGLDDVNLRVLDEEGAEVARDESGESDASAQFCTEHGGEYAAEVYGTNEPGTALFMLMHATAATLGGSSGLWLGERPLVAASKVPLDDALTEASRRAVRDGYQPATAFVRGRLAPGEAVSHAMPLRARRCARIQVVGGPGLRRLTLTARDAAGALLATSEGGVDSTYVHVCGAARELDVQLRAMAGAGPIALAIFDAPEVALTPVGADDRTSAALQQALRSARDAGFVPQADFRAGPKHILLAHDTPIALPIAFAGQCVRAYVVSPDASVRASLMAAGKQAGEPTAPGKPARFCIPADDGSREGADDVSVRLSTGAPTADAWLLVVVR